MIVRSYHNLSRIGAGDGDICREWLSAPRRAIRKGLARGSRPSAGRTRSRRQNRVARPPTASSSWGDCQGGRGKASGAGAPPTCRVKTETTHLNHIRSILHQSATPHFLTAFRNPPVRRKRCIWPGVPPDREDGAGHIGRWPRTVRGPPSGNHGDSGAAEPTRRLLGPMVSTMATMYYSSSLQQEIRTRSNRASWRGFHPARAARRRTRSHRTLHNLKVEV